MPLEMVAAKVALVKVLAEYRVTYKLPDPTGEYSEAASKALKSKGCTVFKEHRHYDIVNDNEAMTIQGFVLEPVKE